MKDICDRRNGIDIQEGVGALEREQYNAATAFPVAEILDNSRLALWFGCGGAMAPLARVERRDLWDIWEHRYQARSIILTSQLHVTRFHEQIGDSTGADGILDRRLHNATFARAEQ